MKLSRREFLGGSLLVGAPLLFPPGLLYARPKGEETWQPAYAKLEREGKYAERITQAYRILEHCQLCPRKCGVNRRKGERGFCRAPMKVMVYSAHPHFGEEEPLVGENGSGTIFMSNCNLRCIFCQNWPIAHEGQGKEYEDEGLADMMISLQKIGCHNINLVTPTHVMPHIINATRIAYKKGLHLPIMYNTSGYERTEILKILDGIIDIYKPDMKYTDSAMAEKYSSGARDYPEVTKNAILEMHRQVGVLQSDSRGLATRGVIIRHLVMPNRVAGTEEFVKWVAQNLPKSTYVNIMAQYRVEYKAYEYPEIARGITVAEYLEAMDWAKQAGLINLDSKSLALYKIYDRRRSDKGQ